jgi:N-acetylglucosamine malate deacetylase 2
MNRYIMIGVILFVTAIAAIGAHIYYLTSLAAKEIYPADTYLDTAEDKNALIIVAHDDDMAGSSGTITRLCSNGWKIREMCFYQQGGLYFKKDSAKNPIRKSSLADVAKIQGLAGTDPVDFNFRKNMETEKSYFPIPYNDFPVNYYIDSMKQYIGSYIRKYNPSVIFTLDDRFGGYGHPDHVLVSKVVLQYCLEHKNDPGFTVKKIYQAVFPPSLSEKVLGRLPIYIEAKKVYQCNGSPSPDVQINIVKYSKQKKAVMKTYITEQNSFRQIWPYYNLYPHWLYFRIFDRDFFRVINIL